MFLPNYSPKLAMQDMMQVIMHRVRLGSVNVPDELLDAEARLHLLNTPELLEVVIKTLASGVTYRSIRPDTLIADAPPYSRGEA